MKRRVFVKNTTLASLGLGIAGLGGCTSTSKKEANDTPTTTVFQPFFELSLAQWSIHKMIHAKELNPLDFAMKANQWGFKGLEYVNHLYAPELEKYSNLNMGIENLVRELNTRSADHGVKNVIMMVDLPPGEGDMAVMDDAIRSKAIESHYPWIDATAALGCHAMRINMFGELESENWKPAAIDALGRLGTYAAERNVNILIENHGYLTSNAALLMEVINQVNLENCGTLPDFGNFCLRRENNERWGTECVEEYDKYQGVEELMPRAKAVSAKSYDFDANGNETTIDYKRMLDIVRSAGYTGYIGVEYEGERLSEEEGILATKDLLLNTAKLISDKPEST